MSTQLTRAEETLVAESAKSFSQMVISIAGRATRKVVELHKLELATTAYLQTYILRHGQVKTLLMPAPIPLRDIYTDAEVVSSRFLTRQMTVAELQESFRKGHRSLFSGDRREDAMAVANRFQHLNVLGAPGAGKSTFLRRVGLESLLPRRTWRRLVGGKGNDTGQSQYEHSLLPVFIELRQFRWTEPDLLPAIAREFEACGFPESIAFVKRALSKGRLLLLLDGIDEVPIEKLDIVLSGVRDLVSRYPRSRFITSCRTAYYKTFLTSFTDVVLADLSNAAIQRFVKQWFSSDEDRLIGTADRMWSELISQPATLELARTPLLLTLICLVYDDTQKLTRSRSSLYRHALQMLMDKWAAEKRIHAGPVLASLPAEVEVEMLSDLAGPSFASDRLFFTRDEIITSFHQFIRMHANAPTLTPGELLQSIEIEQGLLVCRADDVYSFSHVTIQEYLAAHYYLDDDRYVHLIERFFFDDRWHEVVLLLAGMVKGDDVVRRARHQVTQRVFRNAFIRDVLLFVGSRSKAAAHVDSIIGRLTRLAALLALWSALRVATPPSATSISQFRSIRTMFDRVRYFVGMIAKRAEESDRQDNQKQSALSSLTLAIERLQALAATFTERRLLDEFVGVAAVMAAQRTKSVVKVWLELGLLPQSDQSASGELNMIDGVSTESELFEVVSIILSSSRLTVYTPTDEQLGSLTEYFYGCMLLWEAGQAAYRLSIGEWRSVEQSILRTP